ncbi:MAG: hypothetical protein ACRCUL_10135, partial [Plesiomonas sp.]
MLLAIGLLAGLAVTRCSRDREYKRTGRHHYGQALSPVVFDTLRVPRIEPIQIKKPVAVPLQTKLATEPDMTLRYRAERRTIITGIRAGAVRGHRREGERNYRNW